MHNLVEILLVVLEAFGIKRFRHGRGGELNFQVPAISQSHSSANRKTPRPIDMAIVDSTSYFLSPDGPFDPARETILHMSNVTREVRFEAVSPQDAPEVMRGFADQQHDHRPWKGMSDGELRAEAQDVGVYRITSDISGFATTVDSPNRGSSQVRQEGIGTVLTKPPRSPTMRLARRMGAAIMSGRM